MCPNMAWRDTVPGGYDINKKGKGFPTTSGVYWGIDCRRAPITPMMNSSRMDTPT